MRIQGFIILLPAVALIAASAAAQNNGNLPSQITTRDGKTYTGVAPRPEAVYPDGIVVQFQPREDGQPVPGAIGKAKIDYRNLPDDVQKLYPHDAKAAADYEAAQARATGKWLEEQTAEADWVRKYRDLALLNWSLAGDADVSYSVSVDSHGKVTAKGYNRTTPAMVTTNVEIPTFTFYGVRHGLVTDYLPLQSAAAPGAMVVTRP